MVALFLFLKGMTGALAAFSYPVYYIHRIHKIFFIFFQVKGLYLGYLQILGSGVIDCQ